MQGLMQHDQGATYARFARNDRPCFSTAGCDCVYGDCRQTIVPGTAAISVGMFGTWVARFFSAHNACSSTTAVPTWDARPSVMQRTRESAVMATVALVTVEWSAPSVVLELASAVARL